MATHSSILPGNSHRRSWYAVVHGVAKSWTQLSNFTFTFHFYALEKELATHSIGDRNGNPFLPRESQRGGTLVGSHLWSRTEADRTEVT